MANKMISLSNELSVSADEITRVWTTNSGNVYVKLRDGDTVDVARKYGETPWQAAERIRNQIAGGL